jgi:hypothetical protein
LLRLRQNRFILPDMAASRPATKLREIRRAAIAKNRIVGIYRLSDNWPYHFAQKALVQRPLRIFAGTINRFSGEKSRDQGLYGRQRTAGSPQSPASISPVWVQKSRIT